MTMSPWFAPLLTPSKKQRRAVRTRKKTGDEEDEGEEEEEVESISKEEVMYGRQQSRRDGGKEEDRYRGDGDAKQTRGLFEGRVSLLLFLVVLSPTVVGWDDTERQLGS
ncbi:LOW QUALITY PROTEIN: hypothetical protein MGYG_09058 [Nannizzia gypsea CBS 118893]|uniref:Uncharacterized protein n=1 Tax=Arthroderma gypseum (strain ATCC MYA-4604 / CBS 118893) TaxID=535722 RepID=E4UWG9_ARTGP|nr:LOW QUALITY PROTEIN: hypothetical protein MGYG_09058 [Nannizzia gypsea CBS 118893]EFR01725.1 LOW QUALITY PROTEIN: hypothetical protein MGYG_09058 [Nannizzia gypsea CBS 118893]